MSCLLSQYCNKKGMFSTQKLGVEGALCAGCDQPLAGGEVNSVALRLG